MSGLLLPTPIRPGVDMTPHLRALGITMTLDEGKRLDALIAARWVLVRIDDVGERWRCSECNGKHAHFTKFCIPRPFRGLTDGLRAYWQNVGGARTTDLSPEQAARLNAAGKLLDGMPSLAEHHPEMARQLGTASGDLDIGAFVLGTIEPISALAASVYAERINYRARRPIIRFP